MRIEGQDATNRVSGEYHRLPADDPAQRGRDSGNRVPDQQLRRRIRTGRQRGHQHDHEVGHQPISRQRLRLFRQRRPELPASLSPATADGGKFRPRNRRNDFGGTLGGPMDIPKIYNGHNKTFLFFNYEEFLETRPVLLHRYGAHGRLLDGNFSAISPNGNCSLCAAQRDSDRGRWAAPPYTDPTATRCTRMRSTIRSRAVASTRPNSRDTPRRFRTTVIPLTRFDPVSLAVCSSVPPGGRRKLQSYRQLRRDQHHGAPLLGHSVV